VKIDMPETFPFQTTLERIGRIDGVLT